MKKFIFSFLTSFQLLINISSHAADNSFSWRPVEMRDKIAIVAPGYGKHDGLLERAQSVVRSLGFTPVAPSDMIQPTTLGYSNTAEYRANHLTNSLKSYKVVWALRGGRGSSEIVELIENNLDLDGNVPLVIGFSDFTAVHLMMIAKGYPTLHGPVLAYNKESSQALNAETSLQEIVKIINGTKRELRYEFTPLNKTAKLEQEIPITSVVGGNASLIQRAIGTPSHLNTAGKILLLEDTGEEATRLNETLAHFKRAELLSEAKAVIWGDFAHKSEENEKFDSLLTEFGEKLDDMGVPLIMSPDFGHGKKNNPMPFNTPASLSLGGDQAILNVMTNNWK